MPMPSLSLRSADQREYRRGMVLGLTMAEITILLVFLLMLAATAATALRGRQRTRMRRARAPRPKPVHNAIAQTKLSASATTRALPQAVPLRWRDASMS
jgi:hypothetical protein